MIELDGFDFIAHLGTGGMASVWKARQRSLDREVAIKVLSAKFASEPDDVARFQAEARNAGRLKHPGIVQVYDAIFQNGVYCFVMEYVAGYTVGDWVRRKGRLSESECLAVADCVADALEYAWKQSSMVHCDIKPDNVMVDADGTVKLTDLGLSRTVNALRSVSDDDGQEVFGTPAYTSPEQAMGEPDLDCRADMYSLGAMLYHLATGKMLFEGEAENKVMELQVSSHVPNPRTLVPTLSVPFCDLVTKLLAKERQYRQTGWHQVRSDIAAVRLRRPIPSGLPHPDASTVLPDPQRPAAALHSGGLLHHEAPPVKSHSGLVFVAVLVLASAIGGVAWLLSQASSDAHARGPRTPPPQVSSRAAILLAQAEDWEDQNLNRNAEIVARYQMVVDAAPESPEASLARAAIARIGQRISEKCSEVMETLRVRSATKAAEGDYDGAIGDYEGYDGPYAAETRQKRLCKAEELRGLKHEAGILAAGERARQAEEARRVTAERERDEREQRVVASLMEALAKGGVPAAKMRADELSVEFPEVMEQQTVADLRGVLNGAYEGEKSVLQSFASQIGQTMEVRTRMGVVQGKINYVNWSTGDILVTRLTGASVVEVKVNIRDLALPDRLRRMGAEDTPGLRLAKALLAVENGAYDFAREQTEPLPDPIKAHVLRLIPAGR
jgi:serine/threonine-protein kinase